MERKTLGKRHCRRAFALTSVFLLTSCGVKEVDNITYFIASNKQKVSYRTAYHDQYFFQDAEEYHPDLAYVSLAQAITSFAAAGSQYHYDTQSEDVDRFWNDIGMKGIWFCPSYFSKPTTDSMGFGFAHKKIQSPYGDSATLVAIAIRGGNYESEWASNFTIGEEGNAQGFNEAATQVYEGLKEYVDALDVQGDLKIWVSGFSRGGACTNLLAAKLDDDIDDAIPTFKNVALKKEDIYAYTFEAPKGAGAERSVARGKRYANIWNILNFNDIVPLVAPYEFGLTRFGTDLYYPDRLTDITYDGKYRENAVTSYQYSGLGSALGYYGIDKWKAFPVGGEYGKEKGFPLAYNNPSLGRFARQLITSLARAVGSRDSYKNNIQEGLRNLIGSLMSKGIENLDIFPMVGNFLSNLFNSGSFSIIMNDLLYDNDHFAEDLFPVVCEILGANEENYESIKKGFADNAAFIDALGRLFKNRDDLLFQSVSLDNLTTLVTPHYPEISLALLKATDERYYGMEAGHLNDGTYRVLRVDGYTNVAIALNGQTIFEAHRDGDNVTMSGGKISAEARPGEIIDIYIPNNAKVSYEIEGANRSVKTAMVDPELGEVLAFAEHPSFAGRLD